MICGLLHWMIGLSVSNKWKDYVRKWSKHLPGAMEDIHQKTSVFQMRVVRSEPRHKLQPLWKWSNCSYYFIQKEGRILHQVWQYMMIKILWYVLFVALFLQQLVSEYQIPDNKAVNCSCSHGSLHPTTPISTLTIYNFLRATQRLYDIDGPQGAINYKLPFLYNFPSRLLIPLSYVLFQIYHEIAKTLLL